MFKLFAVVFAAILALAAAEPKPGVVAAYSSPLVAPLAYSSYSSPLAYSGYGYGIGARSLIGSPLAYSGYHGYAPLTYY